MIVACQSRCCSTPAVGRHASEWLFQLRSPEEIHYALPQFVSEADLVT